MDAKETVMSKEASNNIANSVDVSSYKTSADYLEAILERVKDEQAEISFPLGKQVGFEIGIEQGKAEGKREIKRYKKIKLPKYQLKKWGID